MTVLAGATPLTGIYETPRARSDRELVAAIADWRASTGPERDRDRRHAMRLLRTERLRRDAERTEVRRKSAANRLRKSAANLAIIRDSFDHAADSTADEHEATAWDTAYLRLLDAVDALENGADAMEHVWQEETAHAA